MDSLKLSKEFCRNKDKDTDYASMPKMVWNIHWENLFYILVLQRDSLLHRNYSSKLLLNSNILLPKRILPEPKINITRLVVNTSISRSFMKNTKCLRLFHTTWRPLQWVHKSHLLCSTRSYLLNYISVFSSWRIASWCCINISQTTFRRIPSTHSGTLY
jgi:hypothetical protein